MEKEQDKLTKIPTDDVKDQITPEILNRMVENQAKELELRAQELALSKQKDDHAFDFGKKALDAKIEDRKLQRQHQSKVQLQFYIFLGIIVLFIAAVVVISLYLNKETTALELIKILGYITAGGLGGYGLGRIHKRKYSSDSSDSDQED